jgi:hypothetical protein
LGPVTLYMDSRLIISLALLLFACSSGTVHLKGEMMSVDFIPIASGSATTEESASAWSIDPLGVIEGRQGLSQPSNPYAPTTGFSIRLATDDSVAVFYTDKSDSMVGSPLTMILHKGSYTVQPDLFGFASGVYSSYCIIGTKKWSKKVLLLR